MHKGGCQREVGEQWENVGDKERSKQSRYSVFAIASTTSTFNNIYILPLIKTSIRNVNLNNSGAFFLL